MEDTITPHEAKRLRQAFKATADKVDADVGQNPNILGDHAEIINSSLDGRGAVYLAIRRGGEKGEIVASIPIDNGMLKRLKRELGFWKNVKSGAQNAFRHGNRP